MNVNSCTIQKFREFHQKIQNEQKNNKEIMETIPNNQTRLEIEAKTEGNITQLRVLVSVKKLNWCS